VNLARESERYLPVSFAHVTNLHGRRTDERRTEVTGHPAVARRVVLITKDDKEDEEDDRLEPPIAFVWPPPPLLPRRPDRTSEQKCMSAPGWESTVMRAAMKSTEIQSIP